MSKEETMVERSMLQRCVNRMAGADVDLGSFVGQSYGALVVAVIDALMEPTPEMVDAGNDISDYTLIPKQIEQIYRAMLSKAKEGTGE